MADWSRGDGAGTNERTQHERRHAAAAAPPIIEPAFVEDDEHHAVPKLRALQQRR